MIRYSLLAASILLAFLGCTTSFQQPSVVRTAANVVSSRTTTALSMANEQDFMRWARASRSAEADDNVVELMRPLGLVLNEDDKGNVYVETVAPKGNAARTKKVRTVPQKTDKAQQIRWPSMEKECAKVAYYMAFDLFERS